MYSRGGPPQVRRKFRGQYVRSRPSPTRQDHPDDDMYGQQNQIHPHQQNNHQQQQQKPSRIMNRNVTQNGSDDIKDLCLKLVSKLDLVESRMDEIALSLEQLRLSQHQAPTSNNLSSAPPATVADKQKKTKLLRGRNKFDRDRQNSLNGGDPIGDSERNSDRRRKKDKPLHTRPNEDSTKNPELSGAELDAIVQAMSRDFFASEMVAVDQAILERSPQVAKMFALAIIEHAVCDVTSPTKISEIATNLSQAVVGIEAGRKFERAIYSALTDISKREDDIAIDAPRYMDTLGQVLGQSLIPLNTGRNKTLMRVFLKQSVLAYGRKSGHKLLASILRALASSKSESYAAQIFAFSNLSFPSKVWNDEFLESQDLKFISKPRKTGKAPIDDVTDLVEQSSAPEKIEDPGPEVNDKTD